MCVLQINVRVTTMDAELEFSFKPNTTGKQLFDQVSTLTLTPNRPKHHPEGVLTHNQSNSLTSAGGCGYQSNQCWWRVGTSLTSAGGVWVPV